MGTLYLDRRLKNMFQEKTGDASEMRRLHQLRFVAYPIVYKVLKYSSLLKFFLMKNGPLPNYSWLEVPA